MDNNKKYYKVQVNGNDVTFIEGNSHIAHIIASDLRKKLRILEAVKGEKIDVRVVETNR